MRPARILLVVLAVAQLALAQPKAVLEPDHHDFGRIPQGARVVHRFPLVNGGDAPLEILRVDSSCGCTTVVVGRRTLAPGERTDLEVTFSSTGLRGPVNRTVEVVTTDPDQPRRPINLQADVRADILAATDEVQFLDLAPGERRRATLKLSSGTGHDLVVKDVELSPAPWLGVATREGGRDLYVDFELPAKRLPRDRQAGTDTILLHLAGPDPLDVTLKVHWSRQAPVVADPARIAWAEAAGQERAATVTLRRRDGKPFRILGARASSPLLAVTPATSGKAAVQRVRVVLAAAAGPGSYDERINLDLDVPDQRELAIRVSAVLQ